MSNRVFVTGGSGFIGTNLLDHLLATSSEVLSYDLQHPVESAHVTHWVSGDLLDGDALLAAMRSFEPTHLVHLGARTDLDGASMDDYAVNSLGTSTVLRSATEYGRLDRSVFASSRLVCQLGVQPTSDFDYCPPNFYARSKVIAEQSIRMHKHIGEWVIVRPTSIWGPWGGVPYRDFFLALAKGRYIHPSGPPVHKHYGYVGNTVFQINRLLGSPAESVNGRTFYLADPAIEVGWFAREIRMTMGLKPPRSVPVGMLRPVGWAGDALAATGRLRLPLNSDRLRNLRTPMLFDLGDMPDIVGPLPFTADEGIQRTVQHLRERGDI